MSDIQEKTNSTPTEKNTTKKTNKGLKRFLYGISAVIFLFILMISGLITVLKSDTGTRKLITFIDEKIDALQIGYFQGNLQEGLTLENIQFHSDGVKTFVEFTYLKWDFSCLWQAEICLEEVQIKNPMVQIDTTLLPPTKQTENKPTELKSIYLPISLNINNILLENAEIYIDHHQIRLAHFHTAITLNNQSGFTLFPTEITDFSLISTVTEDIQKQQLAEQENQQEQPTQPINWDEIESVLEKPLLQNIKEIELPFDFHIQDLQGKNWQYQQIFITEQKDKNQVKTQVKNLVQHIQITDFQLKAHSENFITTLEQFEIQSNLGKINGQGSLKLTEDFPLDLSLQVNLNDIQQNKKPLFPKTEATLNLNGSLKKQTALLIQSQGGLDATLSIQAEFNTTKTPFTLSLESTKFIYPFVENNPLKTKNVNLHANGNLLDYQVNLSGEISGMDIPQSQIQLIATGGINQAKIEQLQLNALQGQANLQTNLDWKNGIEWQSAVNLSEINVGNYLKKWPAVLSGNIQSQGKINSESWDIQIPELYIQGKLSQRNLHLKGKLGSNIKELFYTPELIFNYGDNHLKAKGNWGENSDIQLDINAPNLVGLIPHLSGGITANINLKGRIETPQLKTEITANNFVYQDIQLAKANINANIHSDEQVSGDIVIDLNGFNYGDISLQKVNLQAKGDEKSHQLSLISQGNPIATDLNLSGSFDSNNERWQGTLSHILIKTEQGNISANKPLKITYDNKTSQTNINDHCWKHQYADLCFTEPLNIGSKGNIVFQLKSFNLALINQLTAQENLLKGQLSSQGKVNWDKNTPLNIHTNIEGQDIAISQKIDYRHFKLNLSKINLNAKLADNNLTSKSQIQLESQGIINAELNIQDIAESRKLSGGLHIQKLSLDLVNQLLTSNEKVSGEVDSKLTFSGDLNKPLLNGNFYIRNIGTKIKVLPFNIEQGELALQFQGDRSTLNGHLQSQAGKLMLQGDANWQNINQWQTRLNAEANEFLVELPSLGKVKISPNITAKANPALLELSGDVNIPWARLEIEEFPDSAVSVSSDEVILDAKTAKKTTALPTKVAAKTASGMLIKSDIKIQIGDDVRVNAYGLKSDLQGLLSVKQEKGQLGLFGQIYLKNGRYSAYGQDLLIRKGEISFSGLASQPMLNVEAIRNPEAMENNNVVAGVKVTGIATKPEVNVFSNPALPQDQALSYLLTGRSLENSGETGSSGSIGAALLGLGLAKSGKVVGGIGQAFGIQDLNLGTAGVGESSKVEVSGSITPRLKIKYGVGLFDGLAEVTVRYRLLPQLYLQSVSGVNQAFDLLYQFEF